jgi:hypothetical protein
MMKKIIFSLLAATTLLISGCATTISSQVTTFHEWPNDLKEKSFVVEAMPGQENDPEYKAYAGMLRERLLGMGFTTGQDFNSSELKVVMEYDTMVSELQLPMAFWGTRYDPFWQIHFSRFHRRSAYFHPYFFARSNSIYMLPDFTATRYFLHQLAVSISDRKSGKTLANIKVSTENISPRISQRMPYLLESAFKDFPGENGKTTEVKLPVPK